MLITRLTYGKEFDVEFEGPTGLVLQREEKCVFDFFGILREYKEQSTVVATIPLVNGTKVVRSDV